MKRLILVTILLASVGGSAWGLNLGSLVIVRDDFDNETLAPENWVISTTPGGVYVDDSALRLDTDNGGCETNEIAGTRTRSVRDGVLMFSSRVLDAYAEPCCIYGNGQPRGLRAGFDGAFAIEFKNINFDSGHDRDVACRTVNNGVVTQTNVDIGQTVRDSAVYQIIANKKNVWFYVNGVLMATHTNPIGGSVIPTVPLNVYFGTGDSCAGNVPVSVDDVLFEQLP